MSGSIRQHVAKDGTITWRVRVDIRTAANRRYQGQRTFASKQDAEVGRTLWLEELGPEPEPEPQPPCRLFAGGAVPPFFTPTVYFVMAEEMRAIKIGYTQHVPERLRDLQSATADRLRLVAMRPGDQSVERALHKRFARLRIRGEWFALRRPLRLYITQHAYSPWEYYDMVCPDHAKTLLRAYPEIFGADEWAWSRPMF